MHPKRLNLKFILFIMLTRGLLFLDSGDIKWDMRIHSPIKHPAKSGSPGQDKGHPEVTIAHVAHIWQVIFKIIQPDVLKVHSVFEPVAGVWPWEETERLRHHLQAQSAGQQSGGGGSMWLTFTPIWLQNSVHGDLDSASSYANSQLIITISR